MSDRVALFGGTFDPPHLGHLIIAETIREALALDRVEFLVAADPPHKPAVPKSSFSDRAAMVQAAIAGVSAFALNVSEAARPGPSFTVDTLRRRREHVPDERLWFLIGADSLADLPTWRLPLEILRLARLAVARRPGYVPDLPLLDAALPGLANALDLVDTPLVDIASRDLRRRVRQHQSIRFRTPDAVVELIAERRLYLDPS